MDPNYKRLRQQDLDGERRDAKEEVQLFYTCLVSTINFNVYKLWICCIKCKFFVIYLIQAMGCMHNTITSVTISRALHFPLL